MQQSKEKSKQNKIEDYEKDYDYDNPEAMYETYSDPDAYEAGIGVYRIKEDEEAFE